RRPILHWRYEHADLLPADLPGTRAERSEHHVLPFRRGRRGGWTASLPALPAGVVAGHAGMAGHIRDRVARASAHRRWCARRWILGGARRSAWRDRPPPPPAVSPPSRRDAARRGADAPRPLREKVDRRNAAADGPRRVGRRLWQRPPLQRPDVPHLRTHADAVAHARAQARRFRSRTLSVSPRVSPAVRLGGGARISARARDAWRGIRGRPLLSAHNRARRSRRRRRSGARG